MSLLLVALAGASAACPPAPVPVRFQPSVALADRVMRFGDVADLTSLPTPIRTRAAAIEIMRLPQRDARFSVPADYIGTRAQGQMPILACWLAKHGQDEAVHVAVVRPAPSLRREEAGVAAGVRRHDRLTLVSDQGIVRVSREVEAMQDARPRQRLFVRTADGMLVSTRYAEPRP